MLRGGSTRVQVRYCDIHPQMWDVVPAHNEARAMLKLPWFISTNILSVQYTSAF
eukprot:m.1531066 g.1531066  ORF g.1531066 m.1531066 type:complete len:54 (+) comp25240_c0_seq48:4239-4400(+)